LGKLCLWINTGMKFKNIILVLFLAGWFCVCARADGQDNSKPETNLSRQQNVYKATLYTSADEQIRIQAATELLLSQDPQAKQILLEAIAQGANPLAQAAVCKALVQPDVLNVKSRSEFLDPLFRILLNGADSQALVAAEALVGYDYKNIGDRLRKAIKDESLAIRSRLNAVYALKVRAEKEDIFELIDLLNCKNIAISGKAELALQDLLGLPVGTDKSEWAQVRKELEKQSAVEVSKARLRREMARVHQLEARLRTWENRYIGAIDSLYDLISDDTTRSSFLMQKLTSDERTVQIWALEKVSQWRLSEKTLPASFGPVLISLVSSNEDAVRLATARLLAFTSYFEPAEKLLAQLEIEKNEIVRLEIFSALGEAVNYSAASSVEKTPSETYVATINWAAKYLADPDGLKSLKGAQVLSKLLINDGLGKDETCKYLTQLGARYSLEAAGKDDKFRGALLGEMADLCGAKTYRAESARIFEPLFMTSIGDKDDSVRLSAVKGLINIDEPKALQIIISKSLYDDPSADIRQSVIALTGRVGAESDLKWLSSRLAKTDSEQAWGAMLDIFKRSGSSTLADWISNIEADPNVSIAIERKITLLEMGEQKAQVENQPAVLKAVRRRLAVAYSQAGQGEKSLEYWGKIGESASQNEREEAIAALFGEQLKQNKIGAAVQLIENRLIEKDMDGSDAIVIRIDSQLASGGAASNQALLAALKAVKTVTARTAWLEQVNRWNANVNDPNKAGAASVK